MDLVTELTEAGLLILSLCRQVQGPAIYVEQHKAAAYRTVGIRWTYSLADVGSLESKVLWARDYPDQDAFLEAVTATPEWQFAVANTPQDGEAFVEDADELLSP